MGVGGTAGVQRAVRQYEQEPALGPEKLSSERTRALVPSRGEIQSGQPVCCLGEHLGLFADGEPDQRAGVRVGVEDLARNSRYATAAGERPAELVPIGLTQR